MAALEMLERIESKLHSWQQMQEAEIAAELFELSGKEADEITIKNAKSLYQAFLKEYDYLKIQTVHSFCLNILKKVMGRNDDVYPFELIDSIKSKEILDEAIKLSFDDEALIEIIDKLTDLYDISQISAFIKDIFSFRIKLTKFFSQFKTIDEMSSKVFHNYHLSGTVDSQSELLSSFIAETDFKRIDKYASILNEYNSDIAATLITFIEDKNPATYSSLFLKKTDGEIRERILPAAAIKKHQDIYDFFLQEAERCYHFTKASNALKSATFNEALIKFALSCLEKYQSLKTKEQLMDYDDLLLKTLSLLNSHESSFWILYTLDYAIEHILVDEAQDLSEIQWEIITSIADEFFAGEGTKDFNRTIFIVGDLKQSIYSFQGADPAIFEKIKLYFRNQAIAAKHNWRELDMQVSFRSLSCVLDVVNSVFTSIDLGADINQIHHQAFREGQGNFHVVSLVSEQTKAEEKGKWIMPEPSTEQSSKQKLLAQCIAEKVSNWLKDKKLLSARKRAIKADDIMILVRKRSELVSHIIAEFKKYGIPIAASVNLGESLVVKDLLSVVRFLSMPYDDYNLACLLKSPFFNYDEDKLFSLCYNRDKENLWNRLNSFDQSTHTFLSSLFALKSKKSMLEFYQVILYELGYIDNFLSYFGEDAKPIIESFLEFAFNYDNENLNEIGYQHFIKWFEQRMDSYSSQFDTSEKVRIMTVHASKGLQAPVVIIADAASSEQAPREQIFWGEDFMPYFSLSGTKTEAVEYIKSEYKKREKHESSRLMYVAVTRAEDELHVFGYENNRLENSWYSHLKSAYLDEIPTLYYEEEECSIESSKKEHIIVDYTPIVQNYEEVIRPSLTSDENINLAATLRGEIIHLLLYELPKLPTNRWDDYLKTFGENIPYTWLDCENIEKEVKNTIAAFPEIFKSESSFSEIPFIYKNEKTTINAKIDRIIILEDLIKIIDFKTDHDINPDHHKEQLSLYRRIIAKRFPNHEIETYQLYTSKCKLIKVVAY
jgi:ATP-dependent helicase/nuclease subunit A